MSDINWWPQDIDQATIPLSVITGPAGSGKTTSIKAKRGDDVLVIDYAEIAAKVSGLPLYVAGDEYTKEAIEERNNLLRKLSTDEYKAAYFITCAPTYTTRKYWAEMLKPMSVKVYATQPDICIERLKNDESREVKFPEVWESLVNEWWNKFTYGPKETIYF